jgi:hypothetical protein
MFIKSLFFWLNQWLLMKQWLVSFTNRNEGYSEKKLMTYRFLNTKPESDYARVIIVLRFIFDIHKSVYNNIITNYIQRDKRFIEFIYFYRRSTCFRRFLRPSSGAHKCTYSFRYCQPILLLAATVKEMKRSSISSTVAASFPLFAYLFQYLQSLFSLIFL